MRFKHFLILLIITLLSCSSRQSVEITSKQLEKVWKLEDIEFTELDSSIDQQILVNEKYKLQSMGQYLHFFPDQTFSVITGNNYLHGSWEFDQEKESINIHYPHRSDHSNSTDYDLFAHQKNNTIQYFIKDAFVRQGNVQLSIYKPGIGVFTYEEYVTMLPDYKKDPFYPDNNLWRKKPEELESTTEVKQRLLNYITYSKNNFRAAVKRNSNIFSDKHSMGFIAIYKGGIGYLNKEDVPYQWPYTYYDDRQAWQAYNLFKGYLDSSTISKAVKENWRASNFEILKDVEKKIIADIDSGYLE